MKAILMSIRPEWVAKILNGEKTIEIRKKFPKDYVGWVYIYCAKDRVPLIKLVSLFGNSVKYDIDLPRNYNFYKSVGNGKVVAKFWCDKVEEIDDCFTMEHICNEYPDTYELGAMEEEQLLKKCCLTKEEMNAYYKGAKEPLKAIHIKTNTLKIFDKPKEISQFEHLVKYRSCKKCPYYGNRRACEKLPYCCEYEKVCKAPQNYYYIEV